MFASSKSNNEPLITVILESSLHLAAFEMFPLPAVPQAMISALMVICLLLYTNMLLAKNA